jgi:glycopeptide antibiotics resistance protein
MASLYGALSDAAIYLPIGILAAIWTPYAARPLFRWLFGLAIVGLIELAQVLVRSRYSDVTDVLLGWAGVTLGFWVAASWTGRGTSLGGQQKALRAACLLAFVLLLLAVYLQPFQWLGDQELALARLRGMARVPMEALRQGDLLGMISNVLRKLLLFGVLGWLAAETAAAMAIARREGGKLGVGILAGLAAAATIEVLQAWSPPHVPDLTDVFWGAAGGALGACVAKYLEEDQRASG